MTKLFLKIKCFTALYSFKFDLGLFAFHDFEVEDFSLIWVFKNFGLVEVSDLCGFGRGFRFGYPI